MFDDDMVLAQLRYAGMMETIKIRQLGFPMRLDFEAFYKRYAFYRCVLFCARGGHML